MARTIKAASQPKESPEDTQALRYAVTALEQRVEALEANRPGRKAKPLVALRQDGICAVSPDIDSVTCPDASIFRYQQGCHGDKCKAKQHDAYQRRKVNRDTSVTVTKRRTTRPAAAAAKVAAKTNGMKKPPAKKTPAVRKRLASVG